MSREPETLQYAFVDTSLGRLLVAASAKGVVAAEFGDTDEELLAALVKRFPGAEFELADGRIEAWAVAVALLTEGTKPAKLPPLDLRGTPFQRDVWKALRAIPAGKTLTYAEVARKVGRPTAYRAVAQACARNPVPLAVPCHRVVASDGTLGGFSSGLWRKEALLDREK